MGILKKIFGSKKHFLNDTDFGSIESFSIKGERVGWKINEIFLDFEIEILIEGTKEKISDNQKEIVISAFSNEKEIKLESEMALKQQFKNADMKFVSLDTHFELKGIIVKDTGFELAFQEIEGQNYFFNVYFENNKQIGVSIDG